MNSHERKPSAAQSLPVGQPAEPAPAFGCVVYLHRVGDQVHGRVANLSGIEAVGSDQRQVLGQIVAQFKSTVATALSEDRTPDWVDPPLEKRPEEQKVFLPVHL